MHFELVSATSQGLIDVGNSVNKVEQLEKEVMK